MFSSIIGAVQFAGGLTAAVQGLSALGKVAKDINQIVGATKAITNAASTVGGAISTAVPQIGSAIAGRVWSTPSDETPQDPHIRTVLEAAAAAEAGDDDDFINIESLIAPLSLDDDDEKSEAAAVAMQPASSPAEIDEKDIDNLMKELRAMRDELSGLLNANADSDSEDPNWEVTV